MTVKSQTFEMVINTCFGGYGLSLDAAKAIAERKGLNLVIEGSGPTAALWVEGHDFQNLDELWGRFDRDVIDVVREMGKSANGMSADLRVVTVTVDIDLDNHDGNETVKVTGRAR